MKNVAIGGHMNNWGIPDWLEEEVKERDKTCVYCGIQMIERMPPSGPRERSSTITLLHLAAHYLAHRITDTTAASNLTTPN